MALYFECRINKKRTPLDYFFGDFVAINHATRESIVFSITLDKGLIAEVELHT